MTDGERERGTTRRRDARARERRRDDFVRRRRSLQCVVVFRQPKSPPRVVSIFRLVRSLSPGESTLHPLCVRLSTRAEARGLREMVHLGVRRLRRRRWRRPLDAFFSFLRRRRSSGLESETTPTPSLRRGRSFARVSSPAGLDRLTGAGDAQHRPSRVVLFCDLRHADCASAAASSAWTRRTAAAAGSRRRLAPRPRRGRGLAAVCG